MKITRRQLLKVINETIYAGQTPADADLERVEDEDYGLKIKANIRHDVDDDGKIVPASPVAIVGGDSGDNMQTSIDNIAQGLGASPEISQNFAKIIKLFSGGASDIMKGDESSGVEAFLQAWSLLDAVDIGLNLNETQLTIFLDAMSGWSYETPKKNISSGNTIAPEVFDIFRSTMLFGEVVPRIDEVNALADSGQTRKLDPMFNLIEDRLGQKLFTFFVSGYDDAVNQRGTASLDQFVLLGTSNFPD